MVVVLVERITSLTPLVEQVEFPLCRPSVLVGERVELLPLPVEVVAVGRLC